jgi:transposase-like protein
MPQALLPIIPDGGTPINDRISVVRAEAQWTYFCGIQPVFQHAEDDRRAFRMFTAQLCCQGACTQAEIIRAFGVSKNSVLRSVAKYRREGIEGFFRPRRSPRGKVLTPEVKAEAQRLLDRGGTRREAAETVGVRYETLRKAIQQGRLREPAPGLAEPVPEKAACLSPPPVASDKSARSEADAAAGEEMGIACTRPCERVLAALGMLPGGATTQFQSCRDVSYGGVLCAPPLRGPTAVVFAGHDRLLGQRRPGATVFFGRASD